MWKSVFGRVAGITEQRVPWWKLPYLKRGAGIDMPVRPLRTTTDTVLVLLLLSPSSFYSSSPPFLSSSSFSQPHWNLRATANLAFLSSPPPPPLSSSSSPRSSASLLLFFPYYHCSPPPLTSVSSPTPLPPPANLAVRWSPPLCHTEVLTGWVMRICCRGSHSVTTATTKTIKHSSLVPPDGSLTSASPTVLIYCCGFSCFFFLSFLSFLFFFLFFSFPVSNLLKEDLVVPVKCVLITVHENAAMAEHPEPRGITSQLRGIVLDCAALPCCAVLCCAVLYCVVVCCAVLCCGVLCFVVWCCVVRCCVVMCRAVLCCAGQCCAVLCISWASWEGC